MRVLAIMAVVYMLHGMLERWQRIAHFNYTAFGARRLFKFSEVALHVLRRKQHNIRTRDRPHVARFWLKVVRVDSRLHVCRYLNTGTANLLGDFRQDGRER